MRKAKAYHKMLGVIGMNYHNPVLVSVGANDGVTEDRVIPFCVRNGWKSILIEPMPHLIEKCKLNIRKISASNQNIFYVQSAVGRNNGEIKINYIDPPDDMNPNDRAIQMGKSSACEGYNFGKGYEKYIKDIRVECRKLDDIITDKTDRVSVLSIDVEGYEPEVFAGFSISKWKPAAIIWEVKHLDKNKRRPIMRKLSRLGYRHVFFGPDCISAVNGIERNVDGL
jgi:FkbM family methyltransferase